MRDDILSGKATLWYAKFEFGWQMYLVSAKGTAFLSTLDGRHAKRNYIATIAHLKNGGYLIPDQWSKQTNGLPTIIQDGFRQFDPKAAFGTNDANASFDE